MRKSSFPQASLFTHNSITGEFTNLYKKNSLFLTDSAIGCGLFVELRCCVRKSFGDKYRLRSFKRSSVLSLNKVMTWLTGFHLPAMKAINPSYLP